MFLVLTLVGRLEKRMLTRGVGVVGVCGDEGRVCSRRRTTIFSRLIQPVMIKVRIRALYLVHPILRGHTYSASPTHPPKSLLLPVDLCQNPPTTVRRSRRTFPPFNYNDKTQICDRNTAGERASIKDSEKTEEGAI